MHDHRANLVRTYNEKLVQLGAEPVSDVLIMQRLGRFLQLRGRTYSDALRRIQARSPLDTIQEQQVGMPYEEWRILVCCSLLNMTHGRQVRPMLNQLWALARSPELMWGQIMGPGYGRMVELLRPLGFVNRRLKTLADMSKLYHEEWHDRVRTFADGSWAFALPGCGQYAVDSLNIFRYGILENVSSDTWLNDYIEWRKGHGAVQDMSRSEVGPDETAGPAPTGETGVVGHEAPVRGDPGSGPHRLSDVQGNRS